MPGAFGRWMTFNMLKWVLDEGYNSDEDFQAISCPYPSGERRRSIRKSHGIDIAAASPNHMQKTKC
jgi:hypothetical protein